MAFLGVLTTAWTVFWVVGLAPRTAQRLVDRLSLAGWRAWHVLLAGAAWGWAGGLVAAVSLVDAEHAGGVVFVAVPFILTAGVLARRVELSRRAGPHGVLVLDPPVPGWVDVHGSAAMIDDAADYAAAAGRLATRDPARRTAFTPRCWTPDLDVVQLRRLNRLAGAGGVAAAVLALSWLLLLTGAVAGVRDAPDLVVQGVAWTALAATLVAGGSTLGRAAGRRRHRRAARVANGARVTWPLLAALHGWRLERPGRVPHPHWRGSTAFDAFRESRITPVRPPLVTLSGRIGDWETWVVVGERTCPLVVAVHLPGIDLPQLWLRRIPGVEHDTATWWGAGGEDVHPVVGDDVLAHLGDTLPAFAQLVVEGDLVALVTLDGIAAEPWRVDAMVECVLGVADRMPVARLLAPQVSES